MHDLTNIFMLFIDYAYDLGYDDSFYLNEVGNSNYKLSATNMFKASINNYDFSEQYDLKLYYSEIKIDDA